jgi:hypothetical protein
MAIRQVECPDQKRNIDPTSAQMRYRLTGRAFDYLYNNSRMLQAEACQKTVEKAAGNQSVDADTKPAALAGCCDACGFHGMVDLIDAR